MQTAVKLSSKYQIVLPRVIRDKFHLGSGDRLLIDSKKDHIILRPLPKNYTEYMLGLGKDIWKGIDAAEYVKKERESWEE